MKHENGDSFESHSRHLSIVRHFYDFAIYVLCNCKNLKYDGRLEYSIGALLCTLITSL